MKPIDADTAFVLLLRTAPLHDAFKPELLANDRPAMVEIVTTLLTNPKLGWERYRARFDFRSTYDAGIRRLLEMAQAENLFHA